MRVKWFDDSLPVLAETLTAEIGVERTTAGVALRDATGRLGFFTSHPFSFDEQERLSAILRDRLASYAREDRVFVGPDEPGARRILEDPSALSVSLGSIDLKYIDRRVVGADWLRTPSIGLARPPRFVFSSLKGGVGRSTAISVIAAEQARLGKNVLVVDLDLEAPGIGSLLLGSDRRPRFGVLDYMVERNLGRLELSELDDFVGTSGLTSGAGLVDVAPVAGSRTQETPRNYLAKLSRAMLEGLAGENASPAVKVQDMIAELEARRPYDLVLIDARAGLAEIAAGPLLSLSANLLVFGTAQPQTLEGLSYLLAHLGSLVVPDQPSPWQNLKMVHAKAQLSEAHDRFKDALWELFAENLYEEQEDLEGFNFDVNEPDAPHNPIAVPLDLSFADWDPVEKPHKLVQDYYSRTFAGLIGFITDTLDRQGVSDREQGT